MPNQEVMQRWVAALESGQYHQTDGALWRTAEHDGQASGHCCLGVLCDLAVQDGIIDPPVVTFDRDKGMIATFGESDTFLPEKVMEWAGLDENNPWVDFDRWGQEQTDNLAMLNDEASASFDEIADIIRLNFISAKSDAGQPA